MAERLGLPAAGIMTTKFVSAAEVMARVLGADGYSFIAIEHPISSASSEDLSRQARKAVAESIEILSGASH